MAGDAGGGSAREGERAAVSASADAAPHNATNATNGTGNFDAATGKCECVISGMDF